MIRKILLITLSFMIVLIPILYAATNDVSDSPKKTLPTINAGKLLGDYDYTFKRKERSRTLLWSQIPSVTDGWACQLDTVYPFVADICDDVDPPEAWVIDSVFSWHWNWGIFSGWTLVPFIDFLVYNDNGSTWPEDSAFIKVRVPQANYTATSIGGAQWLVEMELPTPVALSAGAKYWVEIRPCTDFSQNGQTGAMCSWGHGNGQELYFRFPVLGTPNWVTSTTQFGYAGESGFELYGTAGGADTNDVGAIAIVEPGATILPNTTVDPKARFRNFGTETDTFDIYFEIDSSAQNVYSATAQMILPSLAESTYTFSPSWTSGPIDNITYDITAYTVMAGDANPANDTVTSTTTTQTQQSAWKIYASSMPQATYYHACVYTDVTGTPTVYSVGGDPTYRGIFEFDCNTETWSTPSATLNYEARRLAAAVVDGKIYAIGGMPGSSTTAQNYCQEYDPVAGTVTDKTVMPTARQFLGALAWNDTLIYVIGGQSGGSYYNTIEIYDPANDAWTTGTPLPIQNRSFACGIFGNFIYVTGGYNGSGYVAATYIGEIDPANPTSITWTSGPNIPTGASGQAGRSRLQGACANSGFFYFTCGDDHGVPTFDTWHLDASLTWAPDSAKPTAISNSQCAVFVPPLDGGVFFCPGGYNTSSGSATNATEGYTDVGIGIAEEKPTKSTLVFGLSQNIPNPAKNGYTEISYITTSKGPVSLKIYDVTGRLVRTLRDIANDRAGSRTVYWDMKDNNHNPVTAGVYFYRLSADGKTATKKMVIVK